jgi:hypothetical protein
VLPDGRLHVVFVDGTSGEVHIKSFLQDAKIDGTIVEPLRDPALFSQDI